MPTKTRRAAVTYLILVTGWLAAAAASPALPAVRTSAAQSAATSTAPVTFARDIAPIVFEHCSACHRPGGSASFSLLSYADVRAHAERIAAATRSRYMPPWKPEPGYGDFVGARRLSDAADRADSAVGRRRGAGGRSGRRCPPAPVATSAWHLGEPDWC